MKLMRFFLFGAVVAFSGSATGSETGIGDGVERERSSDFDSAAWSDLFEDLKALYWDAALPDVPTEEVILSGRMFCTTTTEPGYAFLRATPLPNSPVPGAKATFYHGTDESEDYFDVMTRNELNEERFTAGKVLTRDSTSWVVRFARNDDTPLYVRLATNEETGETQYLGRDPMSGDDECYGYFFPVEIQD